MSRSGYSDDCDGWALIRWRGAVAQATRGKRGQAMLRELLAALDALPEKRLVSNALWADGEVCTLGALGLSRQMDMATIDPEDREQVAQRFGVAEALAAEIMAENDSEFCYWKTETPEQRWGRMRAWVASQLNATPRGAAAADITGDVRVSSVTQGPSTGDSNG